ncbi:MAG: DUF3604 domain-containing protein [Pseudomonadota bacterium]
MILIGLTIASTAAGGSASADQCNIDGRVLLWGDLHVHTSYSMDAYVWDNQVTPKQAYRFGQGVPLIAKDGSKIRLDRPLDFMAVTDHAEYFGVIEACQVLNFDTPYCKDLRAAAVEDSTRGFYEVFLPALLEGDRLCQGDADECSQQTQSLWRRTIEAAEQANQPCLFTTFVANEWTASPGNLHWHRNLIYANTTVPKRAINSFDEPDQIALWKALEERCGQVEDCDVLAIPHNSNIGMGGAFDLAGHTKEDLTLRARFEKLVEIHQHKGASECFAGSMLSDEDCGFEIMLPVPLLRELQNNPRDLSEAENKAVAKGYVRDTLAKGLEVKEGTGVNPFVYGFVGATDTHSGRPGAVDEADWRGAIGSYDLSPERLSQYTHYNPGGLTAVWAEENTRGAVFAALKRRETYATSGPRIGLVFGVSGDDLTCSSGEFYPMGSTYRGDKPPNFVVKVQQDRVPLQQIDLIKLQFVEGKINQSIKSWQADGPGQADWCITWTDSEFAAELPTAWYVRVLQTPTMRWDGKGQIRERAWSSPIWSVSGSNWE